MVTGVGGVVEGEGCSGGGVAEDVHPNVPQLKEGALDQE